MSDPEYSEVGELLSSVPVPKRRKNILNIHSGEDNLSLLIALIEQLIKIHNIEIEYDARFSNLHQLTRRDIDIILRVLIEAEIEYQTVTRRKPTLWKRLKNIFK